MLSPQQVAQKWANNTSTATQAFKDGVNSVQTAPTAAAAQAQDRYLSGVQQAVASGKWAAKLNAVTLDSWKQSMLMKGAARISGGVTAAIPAMTAFMTNWLPLQAQMSAAVARMPRGNLADSIARAQYAIQFNAAFSKRLPGS